MYAEAQEATGVKLPGPIDRRERRSSFDDLAGLDAAGANADALRAAFHLGLDRAQVHVPPAAGNVMRVGDVISELRTFAADMANLCHDSPHNSLLGSLMVRPHRDNEAP